MKSMRTVLTGALALLMAAPAATAQHVLQMPAAGQRRAFSFTKDVTPAAPIPKLDLSPILANAGQTPDPTGAFAAAEQAEAEGASPWFWGGLVAVGIGGTVLYEQQERDEYDEDLTNLSLGLIIGGAFMMLFSPILPDRAPQPFVGMTRGGVAGGIRLPLGHR